VNERIHVVFHSVGKRFDNRVVFRGVNGVADPGEILTITGPNGSGKSTLVTILCGLARPTRGEVTHLTGDGSEVDRSDWRRHTAVVAPAMSMYEELTALENLRFFARVRGIEDSETNCRRSLEEVGLDPDRRTVVRGFSTGMVQRLKIAQAMLHDPAVVILDEPGSNLDPPGQDWLESWVASCAGAGRTVVLATNDRREMAWGTQRVELAG
jgi:heme exporter protein A